MIPDKRPNFENVVRVLRNLTSKTGGPPASRGSSGPQGMMMSGMPGMGAPYPGGGMPNASANAGGYNAGPPALSPAAAGYGFADGGVGVSGGGLFASAAGGGGAPQDNPNMDLAEVVLEAVSADGIDLGPLPRAHKAIAFAVDPAKGRLSFLVGREYQPDFFERLVQAPDQRQTISRSHFELAWEPPSTAPTLRKLSGNPLILDDRPLGASEATRTPDGTRLGFAK